MASTRPRSSRTCSTAGAMVVDHPGRHHLADRDPELRLVGEVAVQDRFADACGGGHLFHVDLRPVPQQRLHGRPDQLLPSLLTVVCPAVPAAVALRLRTAVGGRGRRVGCIDIGQRRLHATTSNSYSVVTSIWRSHGGGGNRARGGRRAAAHVLAAAPATTPPSRSTGTPRTPPAPTGSRRSAAASTARPVGRSSATSSASS